LPIIGSYPQLSPVMSNYLQLKPVIRSYNQLFAVITSYWQLSAVIGSFWQVVAWWKVSWFGEIGLSTKRKIQEMTFAIFLKRNFHDGI
jgi:hypothetical protein